MFYTCIETSDLFGYFGGLETAKGMLRHMLCQQKSLAWSATKCIDASLGTWIKYNDTCIYYIGSIDKVNGDDNLICSTYPYQQTDDWVNISNGYMTINALNQNVYIRDDSCTTLTQFMAKIKGMLIAYKHN